VEKVTFKSPPGTPKTDHRKKVIYFLVLPDACLSALENRSEVRNVTPGKLIFGLVRAGSA